MMSRTMLFVILINVIAINQLHMVLGVGGGLSHLPNYQELNEYPLMEMLKEMKVTIQPDSDGYIRLKLPDNTDASKWSQIMMSKPIESMPHILKSDIAGPHINTMTATSGKQLQATCSDHSQSVYGANSAYNCWCSAGYESMTIRRRIKSARHGVLVILAIIQVLDLMMILTAVRLVLVDLHQL